MNLLFSVTSLLTFSVLGFINLVFMMDVLSIRSFGSMYFKERNLNMSFSVLIVVTASLEETFSISVLVHSVSLAKCMVTHSRIEIFASGEIQYGKWVFIVWRIHEIYTTSWFTRQPYILLAV